MIVFHEFVEQQLRPFHLHERVFISLADLREPHRGNLAAGFPSLGFQRGHDFILLVMRRVQFVERGADSLKKVLETFAVVQAFGY